MITALVPMFVFALIGAISPGPVNIIATSSGATFGFRRTMPHVLGASISYTLIVLFVGAGLNEIFERFPIVIEVLKYLGGGFLLYMAFKIATSGGFNTPLSSDKKPPGFWDGSLAQVLNPKAWLVSISGVGLFVASNTPYGLYLAIYCMCSLFVCLVGISTWAALGQMIQQYLSNEKHMVIFNTVMGLLLASTVVTIFTNDTVLNAG